MRNGTVRFEPLEIADYTNLFVYYLMMCEIGLRYVTFGLYKPTIFALVDYLLYELDERRTTP